ncbi:hypothetical protein [Microbacterium sp.]|uniref:hypothetical protein n=1 Tax=Microbacterium sp. TaxID=51671 RepID=UPI003221E8AD
MDVDWRDDWLFRIICSLALRGLGLVSVGLLMFGTLALVQGLLLGIGTVVAVIVGGVGLAACIVLARLNAARRPVGAP